MDSSAFVWCSERLSFDFFKLRIEKERNRNLGRLRLDLTFLGCTDLAEVVEEIRIGGIGFDFKKSRSRSVDSVDFLASLDRGGRVTNTVV